MGRPDHTRTAGAGMATQTSTPSSRGGAPVLLLKERTIKNGGVDAYEQAFSGAGFRPRFLAPLSFSFRASAASELVGRLQAGPVASGTAALVVTSPRGVEALRRALAAAAAAMPGGADALRALWDGTSVFMVGAASAAVLHASEPGPATATSAPAATPDANDAPQPAKQQLDLARRCGFEAVHSADVRCATELAPLLRARYPQLCERWRARALLASADADVTSQEPSFLALVGNRHRHEMFNMMAGLQADGTPLPAASAAEAVPIPVQELIMYETHLAEGSSPADAEDADSQELSPFLQQLLSQLAELDAEAVSSTSATSAPSSSSPIYVAFFSPLGVETFFAHTRSTRATALLEPYVARFRFACIGETSAHALVDTVQVSSAGLAPTPLVATQPSATELLRVIAADASVPFTVAAPAASAATSSDAATAGAAGAAAAAADACVAALPASSRPLSPIPVRVPFYKFHGTLNDYVLIDGFKHHYSRSQLSRLAHLTGSDRRGAVGSDGLLYVTSGRERSLERRDEGEDPERAHVHGRMYMFNTDGSEAEMCGNGLRCVAKFVYDHKLSSPRPSTLHLLTGAGPRQALMGADPETGLAASVALDLGVPIIAPQLHRLQGTADGGKEWSVMVHEISMGNPHCIVLLEPMVAPTAAAASADAPATAAAAGAGPSAPANPLRGLSLDEVDVPLWGRRLHDHARYARSNGTNVSFVSVRTTAPSPRSALVPGGASRPPPTLTVDIRTFERGNGETWSCGSGISASVCSVLVRRRRRGVAPDATTAGQAYQETVQAFVRGGELSVTCIMMDRVNDDPAGAPDSISSFLLRDVMRVELSGPATEVYEGFFPAVLDD